jgi:uncharacterized protein YjbI with pentapeptide repeats
MKQPVGLPTYRLDKRRRSKEHEMSDQTMRILKMLEDGKITVEEADRLLAKIQDLEAKEAAAEKGPQPQPQMGYQMPNFTVPPIPHVEIPDVGRIVGDAMRDAFGKGFPFNQAQNTPPGEIGFKDAKFHGARLEHTDFTDTKLDSGTRFEGANLAFADFSDADLRGADLRGADLSYSDFTDAKLRNADLRGARLSKGSYTDANFTDCDLKGADLSMSDLTDADFKGVKEPGLALRGVSMVGLKYYSGGEKPDEGPEHVKAPEHEEEADAWKAQVEAAEAAAEAAARQAEAIARQAEAAAEAAAAEEVAAEESGSAWSDESDRPD